MEPRRSTMGGPLTALLIDCAALVLPVSARGGRFRYATWTIHTLRREAALAVDFHGDLAAKRARVATPKHLHRAHAVLGPLTYRSHRGAAPT